MKLNTKTTLYNMLQFFRKNPIHRFFSNHIDFNGAPSYILGRWSLDYGKKQAFKSQIANEDHCGPCGEYVLTKRKDNVNQKVEK